MEMNDASVSKQINVLLFVVEVPISLGNRWLFTSVTGCALVRLGG